MVEVLELGRRAHVVRAELDEGIGRQVAPAGVPDEDVDAPSAGTLQPGQDTLGEASLVPAVTGQDDVDVGWRVAEHVTLDGRHALAVRPCVECDGRHRERVDIHRGDGRGAGLHRGDGAQPGARREIEHPPTPDSLGRSRRYRPIARPPPHAKAQYGRAVSGSPVSTCTSCHSASASSARWRRTVSSPGTGRRAVWWRMKARGEGLIRSVPSG